MIEKLDKCIESNRKQMVQSLCEIVDIPNKYGRPKKGAPHGEESRRALGFVMDLGRKLGLETVVNVGDRVCYIEYGTGAKVVGVFAHLNIIPEEDGWTYSLSGGRIHNNRVYGHDTVDNKGPFIASLYVLYTIKEYRLSLGDYRIHIVGGANEKKGMDDMKYYVSQCDVPDVGFTPDGLFPMSFTERGINYYYMSYGFSGKSTSKIRVLKLHGGEILSMVPDRAFARLEVSGATEADRVMKLVEEYRQTTDRDTTARLEEDRIEITSRGLYAHSCTPFNGKNAIVTILMLLADLGINGSTGAFLKFFTKKIGMTTDGSLLGMKREDECGKLTFSLSKMDMGEKGLTWVASIHYPYTYKDQVTEDFTVRVAPEGIVAHEVDVRNIYKFPMGHPLIRTLRGIYEKLARKGSTPSHEDGTYAQVMPGTVPFGSVFPGTPSLCHRPDECIGINKYVLDTRLFGNAMYALTREGLWRQVTLNG